MAEDLSSVPATPLPNTPRARHPATPSKTAKRHKGPAGPQEPARLQAPFSAKAPSQRALAFAKAVARQRATTEDNWAVLQKATQCLDTLLAAFDPSEAPHKHKLATELTAALDATIMSFLELGTTFPAVPTTPTAPTAPAPPAYAAARIAGPAAAPASYRDAAAAKAGARMPAPPPALPLPVAPAQKGPLKAKKPDLRLFARLPADSPMRTHSTFAIACALRRQLGPEGPKALKEVQRIPSGLALVPYDELSLEILQNNKDRITAFLAAEALEGQQQWVTYVIQQVPLSVASLLGGPAIEISPATVRDEVLHLTKTTPTAVKWARPNPTDPTTGNMVVSFEASGDPRWRARVPLFGGTCPVRKCERKATIIQCERCHGFHSTRICIKAIRCSHCAATSHQTGDHPAKQCQSNDPHHQCPPRCANCLGPHPATDIQCLLRPKQKNGVVTHPPREQTCSVRGMPPHKRTRQPGR